MVSIPNVSGSSYESAKLNLESMGFKTQKKTEASALPDGTVICTDPLPGNSVSKDKLITIRVSDGSKVMNPLEYKVGLPEEELPDLIVIDGGKGQLSSALEIIRQQAGHKNVPVVGLAKQFELVFKEGESEPVVLPRHSQSLYLIQRIRDEAHRFAITYHRKLRGKRNLVSVLDHIVGIGPKRRQALWSHFGTLAKIKAASVEELAEVDGMNRPSAEAVYNFFLAQESFRGKEKEKK
jgi:excinuclease UvrABC nuclease subunit